MNKISINLLMIFFTLVFTANAQESIQIGSQTWMKKNLDTDRFANGELIPEAKTDEEWMTAGRNQQPAWCYHNNDPANAAKYGRLYNWYAVADSRQLCPVGWHVPSTEELDSLFVMKNVVYYENLGGFYDKDKRCPNCIEWSEEYARKVPCHTCKDKRWVKGNFIPKSKKKRTWDKKVGKDGTFVFMAACRYGGGSDLVGEGNGNWWSSTEYSSEIAWYHSLDCYNANSYRHNYYKAYGFSVRCLKD